MKYLKTLTFIIFANSLFAQNNNQIKLYAVVGSQINSNSPNFNTTLDRNLGGIIDLKKKKNKFDEVELTDMKTNNIKIKTDIIDNNGDKLYSTIYQNPSKETIILLHGGPGFPSDLKEVVDILKDNFQIITFHQRGTKKSPCISNDYSMNAYLSDIECVSKFYNITKFHLWGHSWGGLYAQIYAEKYPDNLLSLFLCCPGSGTNIEWKQTEKEVMQFNKSKCTTWQWTKMGMNNLLGMLGSDNAYKRLFKQVMKNYNDDFVNTENFGIDFNNLKTNPINKTRPEIVKYPTLTKQENPKYEITIVYGDKDIYQSSKNFVINRYPTAKVFTIKNSGHIPWLHNPTEYFQIMKNHYE